MCGPSPLASVTARVLLFEIRFSLSSPSAPALLPSPERETPLLSRGYLSSVSRRPGAHRVLKTDGSLAGRDTEQAETLRAEGVDSEQNSKISLGRFSWRPTHDELYS